MNLRMSLLGIAVAPLLANIPVGAASGERVTTTVYVGRHFEVRDHDQPVKYVFNENDRVARATGSLSNRERLQRLRLQPGWNLISLAVTATNLAGQLERFVNGPAPLISVLYRWRPTTRDFVGVSVGQSIEAGAVLWLRAETNVVVSISGAYPEPAPVVLTAGGGYVASARLESWSPRLPLAVTTWKYDAQTGAWRAAFHGDLELVGDVPSALAPGDAIFVHTSDAVELAQPETAGRILFYHPDHLGSAAAITDASGGSVEETAYYPFGAVRHQHRSRDVDAHYGFTLKEQDRESGLHYFEARYVVSPSGRFPSFDPLLQNLEALEDGELKKLLVEPAKLNPFAYALNNPTRYVDPDGRDARPRTAPGRREQPKPEQPRRELTIRIGPPSKLSKDIAAVAYSVVAKQASPRPTSGAGNRAGGSYSEIQVTRLLDDSSTDLFRIMDKASVIDSVTLIQPGKESEFRIHMKNVVISAMSTSQDPGLGKQTETFTLNAGSIRIGDPEPPASTGETTPWWPRHPRIDQ